MAGGMFIGPRGHELRLSRTLVALRHVAVALSHLHARGISHGALRPSRVLVHGPHLVMPRASEADGPRRFAEAARGLASGACVCRLAGAGLSMLCHDSSTGVCAGMHAHVHHL
jgi:serine/threonine protein kinase